MREFKGFFFKAVLSFFLLIPALLFAQPNKKLAAPAAGAKGQLPEEMFQRLNETLEADATVGDAYLQRGRLRGVVEGDHCSNKVIDDYSNALKYGADKMETYCSRASAYVCAGSHEKAKADLDELFTMVDTRVHFEPFHVRGLYYFGKGELAKAANDFNRSIRNDLDRKFYDKNVFYRASVYLKMHKYEAAIRDFTILIESAPDNDELHYKRSIAQDRMGNKKDAMVDINKAIALNKTHETYYIERGELRISNGEYEAANNDFQKAIELIQANHGKVADIEHIDLLLFEGLNGYFAGNDEWLKTGASKLKDYVPSFQDEEKFEQFSRQHDEKVQASDCLFLLANASDDYTTTINMLNAAMKHHSREAVVSKIQLYRCKARHYIKAGKNDKACDAYHTCIVLGDKDAKKELKKIKCK